MDLDEDAATVWMRSSGYEKAMLWVMEGNDHARAFYEHLGWRPDSAPKAAEIAGHPILERCYRRDLPD